MLFADWLVLLGYTVLVIGVGLYFRHQKTEREFLVASGNLAWWAVGLSLIATSVSSTSFLGSPAEAFEHDLRFLMLNIPVPLSLAIIWLFFIPWFRRSGVLSAYQVLGKAFGANTQTFAAVLYSAHLLLRLGVLIFGPSIVLSEMTGIAIEGCILLVGVVALIYSALGGLRAIVWTDVLQFFALATGIALIYWKLSESSLQHLTILWHTAAQAGKTKWFNTSFSVSDARSFGSAVVAYLFFDLAIRTADQQFVQRYLSCKSVRQAQFSALLAVVLGFGVSITLFSAGVLLWAFAQTYDNNLLKTHGNFIVARFALTYLQGGGAGIVAAGVFAAAMSSIDSALSALTASASQDVLPRLLPRKPNVYYLRFLTVLFGFIGIIIALFVAHSTSSLFEIALSLAAVFPGTLLALFVLARIGIKISDNLALISAFLGVISIAIIKTLFSVSLAWPWWPLLSLITTVSSAFLFAKFLSKH